MESIFNTVIMGQWYEAIHVYHHPLLTPSPRRRTFPPNSHLLQIMTETNLRNGVEGLRKRSRFEELKKFPRLSNREGRFLSYLSAVGYLSYANLGYSALPHSWPRLNIF